MTAPDDPIRSASPLVLYALRYRSGYWATPMNSPIPLLFAEKEDASDGWLP